MSRGRGSRGGRGGMNRSFNREQLSAMGISSNEALPTLVTQPPALFPLMDRHPVPLTSSLETDYLLILRQDYVDYMQLAHAHLKLPELTHGGEPQQEIDKLVAQLPGGGNKEKYDWSLFPSELRPKMLAKRMQPAAKKSGAAGEINIQEKLKALEQRESSEDVAKVKQEEEGELIEEDAEVEQEDEEMDDGTDYANNYFDNGEEYEDDDDNMDEGPIY